MVVWKRYFYIQMIIETVREAFEKCLARLEDEDF